MVKTIFPILMTLNENKYFNILNSKQNNFSKVYILQNKNNLKWLPFLTKFYENVIVKNGINFDKKSKYLSNE